MRDPYKPISKYYDSLSFIYSLGRIPRCRNAFIAEISNSIRSADQEIVTVCFAGAGHCAEAIILAKAGATVTVVDISTSMLDMFQRKLNRVSDEVKERLKIVHDDIRNVKEEFDWVVG